MIDVKFYSFMQLARTTSLIPENLKILKRIFTRPTGAVHLTPLVYPALSNLEFELLNV